MNRKHWIAWLSIAALCTFLAIGLGITYPIPPPPEPFVPRGTTHLSGLNVTGAVDFDSTLNVDGATTLVGALSASSTGTFAGTLAGTTVVDVGTWLNLSAASTYAVGSGATITPTGTYMPITSTAAVTCNTTTCIADGTRTGDILILRNANASDAITIDGTGGNVECKTDKALGSQDTLTLIWNGSDWVCLSLADNS